MDPEVVVPDQHLKIDLLQLLITKDHQDHSITNPDSTKVLCQGRTKVSTEQPSMVHQEVLTIDLPYLIKDLQDHLKINQGLIKVHLWDAKDLTEMPLIMIVPDPLIATVLGRLIMTVQDLLIVMDLDHMIKDLLPVVSTMDLLHEALVMDLLNEQEASMMHLLHEALMEALILVALIKNNLL